MKEELEQAIYWYNRLKREEFRQTDLCLSTVQRNVGILVRHVQPDYPGRTTYRGLCPGCGRAVKLERE
jgi:hypothetical protein